MAEQDIRPEDKEQSLAKLRAVQDTIGTMGWRWFIAELTLELDIIKETMLTAHKDDVRFLQGKADQIAQIIYFEDTVDNEVKNLEQEDDDADV